MDQPFKNSYIVEEPQLMSLSVYNVGYQKCEALHQWGPGIRDHYLIHYVVSGQGLYQVNNQTYTLNSGDAFIVYPYTQVTYQAHPDNPWEYYWVGFSGSDAPSILRATDFSKTCPVITNCAYGPSLQQHLYQIYEARGSAFANGVDMAGHLYTMLALLVRSAAKGQAHLDTYSTYVQKAVDYIAYQYSYPISVNDIADYIGISRSHLYRAFQTLLHQSPKEYLSAYRIGQACTLLKDSDLSVNAIARSVGYDNSLYFSKAFHKIKGLSPTAYAKKKSARSAIDSTT